MPDINWNIDYEKEGVDFTDINIYKHFERAITERIIALSQSGIFPGQLAFKSDYALRPWKDLVYTADTMKSRFVKNPNDFGGTSGLVLSWADEVFPPPTGFTRKFPREIHNIAETGVDGQRARFVFTQGGRPLASGGYYDQGSLIPDKRWDFAFTPLEQKHYSGALFDYISASGGWIFSENQVKPADIITTSGMPRVGDYMGPWILNDLQKAINLLTHVGYCPFWLQQYSNSFAKGSIGFPYLFWSEQRQDSIETGFGQHAVFTSIGSTDYFGRFWQIETGRGLVFGIFKCDYDNKFAYGIRGTEIPLGNKGDAYIDYHPSDQYAATLDAWNYVNPQAYFSQRGRDPSGAYLPYDQIYGYDSRIYTDQTGEDTNHQRYFNTTSANAHVGTLDGFNGGLYVSYPGVVCALSNLEIDEIYYENPFDQNSAVIKYKKNVASCRMFNNNLVASFSFSKASGIGKTVDLYIRPSSSGVDFVSSNISNNNSDGDFFAARKINTYDGCGIVGQEHHWSKVWSKSVGPDEEIVVSPLINGPLDGGRVPRQPELINILTSSGTKTGSSIGYSGFFARSIIAVVKYDFKYSEDATGTLPDIPELNIPKEEE
jgi:hypothetical protein